MATEIERRFLVDPNKLPHNLTNVRLCRQKYLSLHPCVRVRVDSTLSRAFLTIKSSGTITRSEFEYEVPIADALEMQQLAVAEITKIRFDVDHGGKKWEIDFFLEPKDLVMAEIELGSEDEKFDVPPWLLKEVTHDSWFSNVQIAKRLAALKARE